MGIFDRFRRNKQQSVLPDEVQQYYQTEKRQRRGVALGLALVALFVTIALAAGLFFGGRAIYNQIKGDDNNNPSNTANNPTNDDNIDQKQQDNKDQAPAPTPAPTAPAPTPAPAPAPTPAPANPTTPALGDEALPRTGDEGM